MVEGPRPGLTLLEALQAGDRCNKARAGMNIFGCLPTIAVSGNLVDR